MTNDGNHLYDRRQARHYLREYRSYSISRKRFYDPVGYKSFHVPRTCLNIELREFIEASRTSRKILSKALQLLVDSRKEFFRHQMAICLLIEATLLRPQQRRLLTF